MLGDFSAHVIRGQTPRRTNRSGEELSAISQQAAEEGMARNRITLQAIMHLLGFSPTVAELL
jgi:hypothetical protein